MELFDFTQNYSLGYFIIFITSNLLFLLLPLIFFPAFYFFKVKGLIFVTIIKDIIYYVLILFFVCIINERFQYQHLSTKIIELVIVLIYSWMFYADKMKNYKEKKESLLGSFTKPRSLQQELLDQQLFYIEFVVLSLFSVLLIAAVFAGIQISFIPERYLSSMFLIFDIIWIKYITTFLFFVMFVRYFVSTILFIPYLLLNEDSE